VSQPIDVARLFCGVLPKDWTAPWEDADYDNDPLRWWASRRRATKTMPVEIVNCGLSETPEWGIAVWGTVRKVRRREVMLLDLHKDLKLYGKPLADFSTFCGQLQMPHVVPQWCLSCGQVV